MATVCSIKQALNTVIFQPLITLLFVGALLVFLWGIVEFLYSLSSGSFYKKSDKGETVDIKEGKNHMLYGIVGLVVMVSTIAIIQIISNTVGYSIFQCPGGNSSPSSSSSFNSSNSVVDTIVIPPSSNNFQIQEP